jgi:hypothetical protein
MSNQQCHRSVQLQAEPVLQLECSHTHNPTTCSLHSCICGYLVLEAVHANNTYTQHSMYTTMLLLETTALLLAIVSGAIADNSSCIDQSARLRCFAVALLDSSLLCLCWACYCGAGGSATVFCRGCPVMILCDTEWLLLNRF